MSVGASSPGEALSRSRRSKLLRAVIDVLVVVAVFLGIHAYQTRDSARGPAPAWRAATIDGQQLALAEFRGRPIALHFWASWCGVCSAMRPNLRSFAKDQRVTSVASSSGDDTTVRGFVVQHALDAPVIADPSGAIAKSYGVRAFPTTFFVEARGVIRHVEVGYTTELGLRLRLWSAGF